MIACSSEFGKILYTLVRCGTPWGNLKKIIPLRVLSEIKHFWEFHLLTVVTFLYFSAHDFDIEIDMNMLPPSGSSSSFGGGVDGSRNSLSASRLSLQDYKMRNNM